MEVKKEISLSKIIIRAMIDWIVYTCGLAILPVLIVLILSFFSSMADVSDIMYISGLIFFSLTLSVVSIKDIRNYSFPLLFSFSFKNSINSIKLAKKEKKTTPVFKAAMFWWITVLIVASLLFGIIVFTELTGINIPVSTGYLFGTAIFLDIFSFIMGGLNHVIQILDI